MSGIDTVLITGANTGLGLETVKSLCRSTSRYDILLGCRTLTKGEAAIEAVKSQYPSTLCTLRSVEVDLSSDESLQNAVDTISTQTGHLDVLVNNGGANFDRNISAHAMTIREAWNASWDTNVSGTHVLTTLAMPLLFKSSNPRLIFMTSGASTMTETESTATDMLKRLNSSPLQGWPKNIAAPPASAYRSSKAGLNMLMREWTRILKNDSIKIWCISPGFLATGLLNLDPEEMKKRGARDPSIGGDFTVDVIEGKRDKDVGKAIRKDMVQPW